MTVFMLTNSIATLACGDRAARAPVVLNGQLRTADFSGGVGRDAYDGGVYVQSSVYIAASAFAAARAHAFASAHAFAGAHH